MSGFRDSSWWGKQKGVLSSDRKFLYLDCCGGYTNVEKCHRTTHTLYQRQFTGFDMVPQLGKM